MNVLNRKMFANRDARRKLANMGGIISSGPELMEVAQKYAPGGVVEPQQVFRPRSGLGSNIEYTYADFLRENGLLDTPEARRMFVRYQQYMASRLESGQLANPRITQPLLDRPLSQPPTPASAISPSAMEPSKISSPDTRKKEAFLGYDLKYPPRTPAAPSLDTVAPIMSRDLDAQVSIPEDPSTLDPVAQAREDEINSLLAVFDDPNRTEAQVKAARQRLEQIGARDRLISAGVNFGERVRDRIASDAADIYGVVGTGANLLGLNDAATTLFQMQKDAEAKVSPKKDAPKEEVVTKPDASAKVLEAEKDFISPPESNIPDDGLRGSDSLITEVAKTTTETGGDAEAVADTVLTNAGVDTKDLSIKEKAIKYKELFSDLFGDSEAEKQELFWLNMAMIGFGIAAGESPSALKNISGGLLAGASEMQKQRATAREREDKLTMLGVETALAEEAEAKKLAATLNREDRQLTNAIKLAAAKAYIEGANDNEAVDNIVKVVNTFAGTGAGIEKAIEIATRNSNIPEEIMKEVYKQFGITPPSGEGGAQTQPGQASTLKDIPS